MKSASLFKTIVGVGIAFLTIPSLLSAAVFSSTKVELLYGWNYERASEEGVILTLANATGWKYGDSFFFLDVGNFDDRDETDGIHFEWSPRLSLLRTLGDGAWDGFLKDIYVIGQTDIDANSFSNKVTYMGGLSADWNVPGFKFVKTHVQYRDDPDFSGESVQFNLVWNAPFNVAGQNFSFEGFADYTTEEGDSESNLLTQPQLLWHATDNLAFGVEYQMWLNRLGRDGLDEHCLQVMARWTF